MRLFGWVNFFNSLVCENYPKVEEIFSWLNSYNPEPMKLLFKFICYPMNFNKTNILLIGEYSPLKVFWTTPVWNSIELNLRINYFDIKCKILLFNLRNKFHLCFTKISWALINCKWLCKASGLFLFLLINSFSSNWTF